MGRLITTVMKGQRIFIGDDIVIELSKSNSPGCNQYAVAISAPKSVRVLREDFGDFHNRKQQELAQKRDRGLNEK